MEVRTKKANINTDNIDVDMKSEVVVCYYSVEKANEVLNCAIENNWVFWYSEKSCWLEISIHEVENFESVCMFANEIY